MLSLHHCGFPLLLLWILTGVNSDQLTPVAVVKMGVTDSSVTLLYKYSKKVTLADEFYWYRQHPGKPPELLIPQYGTKNESKSRLSATVYEENVALQISSASVSDSAVYYCAVRPNRDGNKMIFGSGTSLTIEPKEETKPSYYVLEDEGTKVCLATGFSRYKDVWSKPSKQSSVTAVPPVNKAPPTTEDPNGPKGLFKDTEAVWVKGSSFFNQVALISSDKEKERCAADSGESGSCSRSMEPDPTVNLASLVTLGLRILFIKTIIFNVLMTLRLWISL